LSNTNPEEKELAYAASARTHNAERAAR